MDDRDRISSRENARIVDARKVRDGKDRTRIFVEGKRLVREALRSAIEIEAAFVADDFRDDDLRRLLNVRLKSVSVVSRSVAESLAETINDQGIFLVAARPLGGREWIEEKLLTADIPIVVLLHEVNNPSNLGAVIRTAEGAGAAGLIVTRNSASAFSSPNSSPMTPCAGKVRLISPRMTASPARSASVTGSKAPPADLSS